MALYTETVMDHFMHPRNVGEIADADGVGEVGNAKCGDIMKMYLKIKDNKIEDVKFETFGCGSAIASSSIATEMIKGRTLEDALARFLRKPGVVTFGTGFQSNVGIISALVGRHDYVICDRENHASIYAGCQLSYGKMLRYRHSDMADLEKCLQRVPETAGALVVTDGVFSMGGDIAKLPEICALAKKYGARVMVDDAHGLGVLGEGGRGTASYFGLEDEVDVYMGTFSKSLASLGGYMAASAEVAEFVRHTSRPFIFSASIPPANCATALAALQKLEKHPELPERLRALSLYARKGLTERGLTIRPSALEAPTPIIPIYTYETYHTLEVAREIYDRGVYVNPTLPPATPEGEALLRTSYMATHTEALLDEAMDIIGEVMSRE